MSCLRDNFIEASVLSRQASVVQSLSKRFVFNRQRHQWSGPLVRNAKFVAVAGQSLRLHEMRGKLSHTANDSGSNHDYGENSGCGVKVSRTCTSARSTSFLEYEHSSLQLSQRTLNSTGNIGSEE